MYHRDILVEQTDPELFAAIQAENARQEHHIELIASENYASPAVMAAQGSQLTNKYAEGYPGKRYYGGCEHVDVAEQLAIDRVKQIFGADAANVQPHCGASANEAVMLAFLKPGDTIMGMSMITTMSTDIIMITITHMITIMATTMRMITMTMTMTTGMHMARRSRLSGLC